MRTYIGKIQYKGKVPSIDEVIDVAVDKIGVKLDYVDLDEDSYLVAFDGNTNWGAQFDIYDNYIEISGGGGRFEGPVVSQALLKILKELGGDGPENDEYIKFPLSEELISEYEKMYLQVRKPRPDLELDDDNNFLIGYGILVLILAALLIWFIF